MRKLLLTLAVVVAGCGNTPRLAPTGQPSPEPTQVVYVPVRPPPTNMDVLRAACWYANDSWIIEAASIVDGHWWAGLTYGEQVAMNDDVCGFDADCSLCWDALAAFVYTVAH